MDDDTGKNQVASPLRETKTLLSEDEFRQGAFLVIYPQFLAAIGDRPGPWGSYRCFKTLRAITRRMISFVPSYICVILASRMCRSIG